MQESGLPVKKRRQRGKRGGKKLAQASGIVLARPDTGAYEAALTLSRLFPDENPKEILNACLAVDDPSAVVAQFAGGANNVADFLGPYPSTMARGGMRYPVSAMFQAWTRSPWLRSVFGRIASSVARVNWRLYGYKDEQGDWRKNRILQNGGFDAHFAAKTEARYDGRLVEIEEHPSLTLLDGVAPMFVGFTLRSLTQIYIDTSGEAFWALDGDEIAGKFVPSMAYPIPSHWVETPDRTDGTHYHIRLHGGTLRMTKDRIVRFHDPDPLDPYGRGSGVAMAGADILDIDEYSARHISSTLLNRARPDVIVSADGLGQSQTERLERRWLSQTQGPDRTTTPFFMSRKVDVKELSQSFASMEMTNLRGASRDSMQMIGGIPPEMIGNVANANRSTVSAAETLMARNVVIPRLEFMRQVLQSQLISQYDDRLIISYDNPVEEDRDMQLQAVVVMPDTLRVDEMRKIQGLPPTGDAFGKTYIVSNRRKVQVDPVKERESTKSAVNKKLELLKSLSRLVDEELDSVDGLVA